MSVKVWVPIQFDLGGMYISLVGLSVVFLLASLILWWEMSVLDISSIARNGRVAKVVADHDDLQTQWRCILDE